MCQSALQQIEQCGLVVERAQKLAYPRGIGKLRLIERLAAAFDIKFRWRRSERDGPAQYQRRAHEAVVEGSFLLELLGDPFARLLKRASAQRFVQITRHPIQ